MNAQHTPEKIYTEDEAFDAVRLALAPIASELHKVEQERDRLAALNAELTTKGEQLCCDLGNSFMKNAELTNVVQELEAAVLSAYGLLEAEEFDAVEITLRLLVQGIKERREAIAKAGVK